MCDCSAKLMSNHNFIHYDKKYIGLGLVFDDFGFNEYIDENKELHKIYSHKHDGVFYIDCYIHIYQEIPNNWKFVRFVKDNTVISQIKELIMK